MIKKLSHKYINIRGYAVNKDNIDYVGPLHTRYLKDVETRYLKDVENWCFVIYFQQRELIIDLDIRMEVKYPDLNEKNKKEAEKQYFDFLKCLS